MALSNRQPDHEQTRRIELLSVQLRATLPQLADYPALSAARAWELERDSAYEKFDLTAIAADIDAHLGSDAAAAWVDWLVFPLARGWQPGETALAELAQRLAWHRVHGKPDAYVLTQAIARARHILEHASVQYEKVPPSMRPKELHEWLRHRPEEAWLAPDLVACLKLIQACQCNSEWLDFAEFLLAGSWNRTWQDDGQDQLLSEQLGWMDRLLMRFALAVDAAGRMDAQAYRRAVDTWGGQCDFRNAAGGLVKPRSARKPDPEAEDDDDDDDEPTPSERLGQFATDYLSELVGQWPESNARIERAFNSPETYHERWLLLGLAAIERTGLAPGKLSTDYGKSEHRTLLRLINLHALSQQKPEAIVESLRGFSQQTLLTALPFAGVARNLLLQALGWPDLIPLQHQLFTLAGIDALSTELDPPDLPNCTSTSVGVLDRPALDAAFAAANPKHLAAYLKALWASKLKIPSTRVLIDAYLGNNRAAIEKKLVRHAQGAIRAYGALPVNGPNDLRERYLALLRMHKEVTQYGPERQANSQAAVKAGIENLARVAGYSDPTRLEWAMEAEIAESAGAMQHQVGEYSLRLVLEGLNPSLQIGKAGKILKSIPAAVRKFPEFEALRSQQAQLKDQVRRFRKALEGMLADGELLPRDDLEKLARLPAMRLLLDQLLLQTAEGVIGWFDGANLSVLDLSGTAHPISSGARLAHPLHLYQAQQLSDWQRSIVQQRRVQPFKQAFRELYLLTPAELETRTYSNRFAGHVVTSAVTSRLLQARGWSVNNGEYEDASKYDRASGITAYLAFPDMGHFLAETETITLDRIRFARRNGDLPLAEVPPLLFSEIMRDADLVASVAQFGEGQASSSESMQRRAELVSALMRDIGFEKVRCEGHFAYIQGQLANYRIHLGSAVIHIEPGNYLCIVPERAASEDLYLPFADTDRKMSEVISKIFLLLDDASITDESILAQIRR